MPKIRSTLDNVIVSLEEALAVNNTQQITNIFAPLDPADMEEVFRSLTDEEQVELLRQLPNHESADILEVLNDELVADLISDLDDRVLVEIIDEMEPDKAADLLGDVAPERVKILLDKLEDDDEVRPLLIHPDDSAGGLMTTEFLAMRRRMTATDALQAIREWSPEEDTFYYLFVVDAHGVLKGVLSLRRLIISDPHTLLQEIMDSDVYMIQAGADQEEAAILMARYDLLALPVVDTEERLLGIITIDDVVDVLEEEATEDFVHLGGAEPLNRPYLDASIFNMVGKRISWLLLLFFTGTLTGFVIRFFQGEAEPTDLLTVFIPLIIGTGGNAGSQTTATIISALSAGDVNWRNIFSVWWRELKVGLLLGLGMASAAFIFALRIEFNLLLATTVSLSIWGIVLWATSSGSILPLLASRIGIDPTIVSGPVMSTIVDATGLAIYFSLARLILGL